MPADKSADLGFACLDLSRAERCGRAEVIFAEGKTPSEVTAIAQRLAESGFPVLATRASAEHMDALQAVLPDAVYHARARCIVAGPASKPSGHSVGVVCAGTSDLAVAEEALVTLRFFGHSADLHADLGVAGLHRLLSRMEVIRAHAALAVVAGMEGALPSVVAGLVKCPVIAVPTSIGYGAGAGGIAALMGMLTSCASGLSVVNIDNGFGAAAAIDRILGLLQRS